MLWKDRLEFPKKKTLFFVCGSWGRIGCRVFSASDSLSEANNHKNDLKSEACENLPEGMCIRVGHVTTQGSYAFL